MVSRVCIQKRRRSRFLVSADFSHFRKKNNVIIAGQSAASCSQLHHEYIPTIVFCTNVVLFYRNGRGVLGLLVLIKLATSLSRESVRATLLSALSSCARTNAFRSPCKMFLSLLLPDFNKNWNVSADVNTIRLFQIR